MNNPTATRSERAEQSTATTSTVAPTCPAENCATDIEANDFMCGPHWSMLPASLQASITATLRPEHDAGTPVEVEYQAYAAAAIAHVAHKEKRSSKQTTRVTAKTRKKAGKPVQLALFEVGGAR